jgi:hypothetical protein
MTLDEVLVQYMKKDLTALEAYTELKKISVELVDAMNELKAEAVEEAVNSGQTEFDLNGATVKVRKVPGRWDYSNVVKLDELKNEIKNTQKEAQESGDAIFVESGEHTVAVSVEK